MTTINVTPSLLKGYNIATFAKPDVTVAGSSGAWTTANSPITLFTVTGLVLFRVYGVVGATGFTSAGPGTGTLQINFASGASIALNNVTANGTNLAANTVWVDATTTATGRALSGIPLTFAIQNGSTLTLLIGTNNMTAGSMTIYADWIPVSSGATVVAATP